MRKTLTTAALLLALNCPTFAGEIATPGSPTPPPPASPMQEPADDVTLNGIMHNPGEIHTPGEMHTPGVSGSLARVALDLLAILPSIL